MTKSRPQRRPASRPAKAEPPDDGNAFLPDYREGPAVTPDDLAENLAEEFVKSATSAEEASEDVRDELVPEELGGPFLEKSAADEFDEQPDASNPDDATKEPFPTAIRSR